MVSKYLLFAQLVLVLLLFYFGNIANILNHGVLTITFTVGMVLGLWALCNMGLDTFSPFPEPKSGGKHVQSGVYKYIRHPMYTAITLLGASLFFSSPNFTTLIIYMTLLYVLDAKAILEEKLLSKVYKEYDTYQKKTKKFIPYIY